MANSKQGSDIVDSMSMASSKEREALFMETVRLADQISTLIKDGIAKTRRLARGLCPVYFDHGLESSLRELVANTLSLYDVECMVECRGVGDIYHRIVVINLYHIAGEAVQNAIRHGRANNIEILLAADEEHLCLSISDDGLGMDGADDNRYANQSISINAHGLRSATSNESFDMSLADSSFQINAHGRRPTTSNESFDMAKPINRFQINRTTNVKTNHLP
jgi:signal transduction histidine kinase